jgi:phospholipase C
MPYLASLGSTYGRTTNYRSLTHPSLPNYLAMAGGSTFNVHDDSSPASHALPGSSVFDVALGRGQTAKTYAESMSSSCQRGAATPYAVKHNPWAYFSQHRASCARYDVAAGSVSAGPLRQDITSGRLPRVGMVIPNLCNDAHDCSLRTADAWLHR